MSDKKQPYESEWLESLRSMTPEQKEEYLRRKFEEGRRQARAILGKRSKPKMTRQELRDMLAEKYPGLTLSDQIIEDRKSDDKAILDPASPENLTGKEPQGVELPDTPQWIYEMANSYGKPTVSREELQVMLDKELDGESLSDFLIRDRRKNPY